MIIICYLKWTFILLCFPLTPVGQSSTTSEPPAFTPIVDICSNVTNGGLENDSSKNCTNGTVDADYKLGDWMKCTPLQKESIKDGFSEMIDMIGRDYKFPDDPPDKRTYYYVDWTSAVAIDFFGPAATIDKETRRDILGTI